MLMLLLMLSPFQNEGPVKRDVPGVTNFTRVDATVACGGATDPSTFPLLKNDGFRTVINLRQAGEKGFDLEAARGAAERAGLRYVHLPVDGTAPDAATVDEFLRVLRDDSASPVYIHCGTANRVGALWAIKRMVVDGWAQDRALDEARAIGLRSPALERFAVEYAGKARP